MELLLTLVYTALFVFIISKNKQFQLAGIKKHWLIGAFLLKIIAAYAMVWIYTYHYPNRNEADIFKFFDDGKIIYSSFYTHPSRYFQLLTGIYIHPEELKFYLDNMHWWYKPIYPNAYNESRIMIRLNAFWMIFSMGKYMVHTVFMSFLAFIGSLNIYKLGLRLNNQVKNSLLLGIILLLPSAVFWCSGVLKEGLVLFGLGGLLYNLCFTFIYPKSWTNWIKILSYLLLLILAKPYLLICLLPGLLALFIANKNLNNKVLPIYIVVNSLSLLVLFNLYRLGHHFDTVYQLCYKRGEFIYLAEQTKAGSLLFNNYLNFNAWAILKEAPIALFHVLLSPLPWQAHNSLMLLCAIENLVILAVVSYQIVESRKLKVNNFQTSNFKLFLISFLLYTFVLIGLTTPIAGSLVRYRAPLLPILFIIVFYFPSHKRTRSITS